MRLREAGDKEACPPEVECEEEVWFWEVFLLAIPLEDERSGSEGEEPVFWLGERFDFPGCKVLLPLLPGEEDEVMAVTSASRPSLTTLTASTSIRRPSSSSRSPLLSFRLSCLSSLLLLPASRFFNTPCLGPLLVCGTAPRPWLRLRVSTPTTAGDPKETL